MLRREGMMQRHRYAALHVSILAILLELACQSETPTAVPVIPVVIPVIPVIPPTPPVGAWEVAVTTVSASGPGCFVTGIHVGQVSSRVMLVERSGSAITVLSNGADELEFPTYTGTIDASQFTAESPSSKMPFPWCPDGPVSGMFEGRLTGRFSADLLHLTARETWVYRFASGEADITFEWTGDHLPR
jgi:hypothetical protein